MLWKVKEIVFALFEEQCGVGGVCFRRIQVEGLQYVERLIVSGWLLKCNCFFMVWMRRVTDFCGRGSAWRLEV